jgi:hypothetical protein
MKSETDIVMEDRDDNPVLIAQVKPGTSTTEEFERFWRRFAKTGLPFGLYVDLEQIRLLSRDSIPLEKPLATLRTVDVLRAYSPDFQAKERPGLIPRIYHQYVETLVGAWLRDLAYHWKSNEPPGTAELSTTGLLERIQGGMTRTDVTIVVDPLH